MKYLLSLLTTCSVVSSLPTAFAEYEADTLTLLSPASISLRADAVRPQTLCLGEDGWLYGIGHNDHGPHPGEGGIAFRIAPDGSGYESLLILPPVFSSPAAHRGTNTLVDGGDGRLYGVSPYRGSNVLGSFLYSFARDGSDYRLEHALHQLQCLTLSRAGDNLLAGVAERRGGGQENGIVWAFRTDTRKFRAIHHFLPGSSHRGGLLLASDGNLYGSGDDLYSISPGGGGFRRLDVPGAYSNLVEGPDGRLRGIGPAGLFAVGKDGAGYEVLADGLPDAEAGETVSLVSVPGGWIAGRYQVAFSATHRLFRIREDGSAFEILAETRPGDGVERAGPTAFSPSLAAGPSGEVFGLSPDGGERCRGTFFGIPADGGPPEVRHDFGSVPLDLPGFGAGVSEPPIEGSDGMLYGGGVGVGGSEAFLYRMSADGDHYEVLAILHDATEIGGLIEGSDGRIYGYAEDLANFASWGQLFSIEKDGGNLRKIHSFGGGQDAPRGNASRLLEASDGMLYGTTFGGGVSGGGTLYRIGRDGTGFAVLHAFGSGSAPVAAHGMPLVEGPAGKLYGATSGDGGGDFGTVWRIDKDGLEFEVLHAFGAPGDGASPNSLLLKGSDGMLYGTTGSLIDSSGNLQGVTAVYRIDPADGTYAATSPTSFVPPPQGWPGAGEIALRAVAGDEIYAMRPAGAVSKLNAGGGGFTAVGDIGSLVDNGLTSSGALLLGSSSDAVHALGPAPPLDLAHTVRVFHGGASRIGADIAAPALIVGDGFVYGTARAGGAHGGGIVFRVRTDGVYFEVLHEFGADPADGLRPRHLTWVEGEDRLVGVCESGPDGQSGSLFSLARDGSDFQVHRRFVGTGEHPGGRIFVGGDGCVYGPRFRFDPAADLFEVVHVGTPSLMGQDGRLYGIGEFPNIGGGVDTSVYAVATDGTGLVRLRDYEAGGAAGVPVSLAEGDDGLLYGLLGNIGGPSPAALFRMGLDGGSFQMLAAFEDDLTQLQPWGAGRFVCLGGSAVLAFDARGTNGSEVYPVSARFLTADGDALFTVSESVDGSRVERISRRPEPAEDDEEFWQHYFDMPAPVAPAAWLTDHDNDGLATLIEYAVGSNPVGPQPASGAGFEDGDFVTRFNPAASGVEMRVETSDDLAVWDTLAIWDGGMRAWMVAGAFPTWGVEIQEPGKARFFDGAPPLHARAFFRLSVRRLANQD